MLLSTTAKAQCDTVVVYVHDTVYFNADSKVLTQEGVDISSYDKRVHRYRNRWYALIPTHFKLQYAGNMGFLSGGIGWDYGKRGQWETDIFLGFLPKYESDKAKMTFTLKQTYNPWSIQIAKSKFAFEPLSTGLYFNTVFNEEFWARHPKKYADGYYDFNTKIRTNIFIGERFSINVPEEHRFFDNKITFFYEVSTNDLMLISYIQNPKSLPFKDVITLSVGVKFQYL